jgi:hypothetical protein
MLGPRSGQPPRTYRYVYAGDPNDSNVDPLSALTRTRPAEWSGCTRQGLCNRLEIGVGTDRGHPSAVERDDRVGGPDRRTQRTVTIGLSTQVQVQARPRSQPWRTGAKTYAVTAGGERESSDRLNGLTISGWWVRAAPTQR